MKELTDTLFFKGIIIMQRKKQEQSFFGCSFFEGKKVLRYCFFLHNSLNINTRIHLEKGTEHT